MPPRRSTRSARSSVDPDQQTSTAAAKRKRSEAPSDAVAVAEKENIAKPSRKPASARSSVGPSSKGRASTRSRVSLKEVVESDEEEEGGEASPPPVKKSRPSPEVEDSEDEDMYEEEEAKPKARKSIAGKRRTKKDEDDNSDEEWDEPPKAVSKTRKSTSKPISSRKPGSRKSTARPRRDSQEGSEGAAMNVSEEDRPPKTPAKKPLSRASAHITGEEVLESEVEQTPVQKAPKGKPRHVTVSEDEDDTHGTVQAADEGESTPTPFSPEEEEAEKSLLEPIAPPISQSQAPPPPEEPKGPKSRLTIHKMALVNFKSYAGRQEIGPFHKSFSSIVGPNGSGKSNTIDALLFVFGYRASKMRQGKLSELIHNSARYPDLDECSVEVHFREIIDLPGPDAYKIVPNSNLVVARTAFKNNSSKYTINGRSSNFTEVQTLLKGRGIDLDHKRFLILQGEVESIAQMKPKAPTEHEDGLLEYLEDIIGTSKYKEPIDESLVEMERLSEDRGEKLNRLRIVEREKNALEEKKKEAEDYLRLQNEHVRALSRLWQWYLWKCLLNEEEFSKNIARFEKELAEETERNKDDIAHLEALEKHYVERGKAYEEVKAAAAEAVKDLAVHEKQQVGLEERSKHAKSKAKKLKKSLQDDENAKAAAVRTIEDSSGKMKKKKTEVEELELSLDQEEKVLEGIRDSLKDKTQVFHDQIEVKQKELQPWTAKINTKQAEFDVASSERDALAKKAEAVRQASKEAQEALEKLQADQETKSSDLSDLKSERANLQKDIKTSEKKLQDTQARVHELRAKASSSRQKAEEAKASQAASTSQNKVLDSLTKLKNAGRITGFHGRLGSLGTIPDKYDVAVSTACGALNNLIVDTVEQGQACIEYLRKQNVGRASFMVLEKLSKTNGLDKIATPENVPRLFDLIKPKEPRFAPAFFKGVGNTLVVDDLEQANRIAFGGQRRWRVVTLAGQLIDSSGTMSGGGNHVAKGGMSSKLAAEAVRPETLKVYEKESEEAVQQLEEAQQLLRQIETEVEGLGKSGPQIDLAIEKINLDIQGGSRRISEAEKRVRELKAQSKPDASDVARISTLEQEIAAATKELEDLQEKSGAIQKAIKELEKKILDIGGAKLLTQKSKVDGIKLHINLANDEITKAEVAKAKAEKDSVKYDSAIETNRASLDEVEGELKELMGQLEECVQYVTELRAQVEAAQAAAEHSKDDLESLKAELDTKTEEIQAFRQKEMELQQSLNDTRKEAADNERTLQHWQNEHDKLKLEDVDDDDDDDEEIQEKVAEDVAEPVEGDSAGSPDGKVKSEVDEIQLKKKVPARTPSYELHIYSAEELAGFKKREMIADAELLDEKLKNAKPNLSVLKEYRKREEEFLKRAKDLEEITNLRDEQKQKYDGLRKQRLDEFMAGFSLISMKLKEMYQMITLGGNAELELVDSMDPFSEGIIFSVMPPKKSWKNISNLSGGEKTLSSLALVFALHVFKPTPLYFMDEIDAALDFRNVSIVAHYIKERTKNAQFIIISLRNDMFELANRLIGIYKTANATQSISIDNHALTTIPTSKAAAAA